MDRALKTINTLGLEVRLREGCMPAGLKLGSGSGIKGEKALRYTGVDSVLLFVLTFLCWHIYEQVKKR